MKLFDYIKVLFGKDVNWDKIQRMRFANADQEITPPEDFFTEKLKKK